MKKITIFILLVIMVGGVMWFLSTQKSEEPTPNNTGDYLGGYYEGNYVWAGAMNLAWNELNENILGENLKLDTEDKLALGMVEKFNNTVFTKDDLDEASYYIKSGYGQETVDLINKESREKFPTKSFADLNIILNPKDIISYAYFLKEVEYLTEFKEKTVNFKGMDVKGFYTYSFGEKKNVEIIKYWNNDKFIISLQLKDDEDELFLAKGFDMTSSRDIVNEINMYNVESNKARMGYDDIFEMPKIQLDHHREYQELINKSLVNENFEGYFISEIFENIKFDMDHKGARVESEAAIVAPEAISAEEPKIKEFILDKPFWIVMKRTDSSNPYFILGVNNENIMEKD